MQNFIINQIVVKKSATKQTKKFPKMASRMRSVQDIIFVSTETYGEIFKSALVYL